MKSIYLLIVITLLLTPLFGVGLSREPLYIVNGEIAEEGFDTNSNLVDKIEMINGEEAVEMYGIRASNGVVLVTLKFEKAAIFSETESLRSYISKRIKWVDDLNSAQVIFKYNVDTLGRMKITEILESNSKKLTKRIYKVVDEMPLWLSPATNMNKAVGTSGTERIKVPYKE